MKRKSHGTRDAAAVGAGLRLAVTQSHPLAALGQWQNHSRINLEDNWVKGRTAGGLRSKVAAGVRKAMPGSIRKSRAGRDLVKTISRGRHMSLYHTTTAERAPSIMAEGFRAGKGGTFNGGGGQIFLGKPLTVAAHALWQPEKSAHFGVMLPRRARAVRDWQHAGAWVVRHPRLSRKLVRPISSMELTARSVPALATAAAIGVGAQRAYKHFKGKKKR